MSESNTPNTGPTRHAAPPYPRFLCDDLAERAAVDCRVHVIPCPLERSVSYGSGTAAGPLAILQASRQLELWLEDGEPGAVGIHTAEAVDCERVDVGEVIATLGRRVVQTHARGHFPLTLGGEHALSAGPILALAAMFGDAGEPFGVVQVDAHADLRDAYQGDRHSHASVMRRVTEAGIPLFQIGIRSLCREEIDARSEAGVGFLDARRIAKSGLPANILPPDFPRTLYLSFDVDALDASIMPATGTPEPGGLMWYDAVEVLENVSRERRIVAADVVELAPTDVHVAASFTAAKLAYQIIRVSTGP